MLFLDKGAELSVKGNSLDSLCFTLKKRFTMPFFPFYSLLPMY